MSERVLKGLSRGIENLPFFISFVHQAVHAALLEDGHCKSYEGTVSVIYPSFFEMQDKPQVTLQLDCYVLGPGRSKTWSGTSIQACIDEAVADVRRWIEEDNEDTLESSAPNFGQRDTQQE